MPFTGRSRGDEGMILRTPVVHDIPGRESKQLGACHGVRSSQRARYKAL